MSEELFVTLPSGCRTCYQVFGNSSDPAILIISGHGVAMTQKTDELVQLLLSPADDSPHFVVRYDHRDTGRSTSFPRPADGSAAYTLDDMVDDAVGSISHLDLAGVHLVGHESRRDYRLASGDARGLALVLNEPCRPAAGAERQPTALEPRGLVVAGRGV